jgi:hypothetical protein
VFNSAAKSPKKLSTVLSLHSGVFKTPVAISLAAIGLNYQKYTGSFALKDILERKGRIGACFET